MSPAASEASTFNEEWHPSYWVKDTHDSRWEKVKAALQHDWESVKQEAGMAVTKPPHWVDAEAGVRYGYGAQLQYGATHEKWNDLLEVRLSTEWDEVRTGKPFSAVRAFVRHGWSAKIT